MATRTSTSSGLFSAGATWVGGVAPVDGDAFVIASGHSVEFDQNTSAYTGFAASTINSGGKLFFSRTAGSYYLKMNANLTVNAALGLDASDGSGGAYPNICFATLKFASGFGVTGSGTCLLKPTAPTHTFCKLTVAASASATVLTVDTDLTAAGDSFIWANARLIRIDDINQAQESEQYAISSLSATQITLSSGLTNAKSVGAYLLLVSGNVETVGAGTAAGNGFALSNSVLGVVRDFSNGLISSNGNTVTTVSGCNNGLNSSNGNTVTTVSGCNNGLNGGGGNTVTTVSGCNNGLISSSGNTVTTISGCTNGLYISSGNTVTNFSGNTRDLNAVEFGTFFGCLMGSATEFLSYNTNVRSVEAYVESFDHDQVAGAYRNWCRGGITSSTTGTVYGSRARSYQHVLELTVAGSYSFRDQVVLVPAGGWVNATAYLQKDASMSYLPRLQIFPASKKPLISGTADFEQAMTNSTGVWEIISGKLQNTGSAPQLIKVRLVASNGSGNFYEDADISVSPFGYPAAEAA